MERERERRHHHYQKSSNHLPSLRASVQEFLSFSLTDLNRSRRSRRGRRGRRSRRSFLSTWASGKKESIKRFVFPVSGAALGRRGENNNNLLRPYERAYERAYERGASSSCHSGWTERERGGGKVKKTGIENCQKRYILIWPASGGCKVAFKFEHDI